MRDIKISFKGPDTYIDINAEVTDKNAYKQECLVNILTNRGSDPYYEERGTTLMKEALGGTLISATTAQFACNNATLDTLFFCREQDTDLWRSAPWRITELTMSLVSLTNSRMTTEIYAVYADETEDNTRQPLPIITNGL